MMLDRHPYASFRLARDRIRMTAWTPQSTISFDACWLSVAIDRAAASSHSFGGRPICAAKLRMPVPRELSED